MKNILFAFFIVLFSFLETNAQTIINNDSSQANKFVISTDKTRVFYKGFENPLSISECGNEDDKINVTVDGFGANIRKISSGKYIVTCLSTGTIVVNVNDGNQIQRIAIPVKRIPDPLITIGPRRRIGGMMSASEFRSQYGVIAELRDFNFFEGIKFNVISYKILFKGKDFEGNDFEENVDVTGPAFGVVARPLLKKCIAGTTVMFGDFKVAEPGGGLRQLDQIITFILQ
jgi:hypothetical protein